MELYSGEVSGQDAVVTDKLISVGRKTWSINHLAAMEEYLQVDQRNLMGVKWLFFLSGVTAVYTAIHETILTFQRQIQVPIVTGLIATISAGVLYKFGRPRYTHVLNLITDGGDVFSVKSRNEQEIEEFEKAVRVGMERFKLNINYRDEDKKGETQ